MNPSREFNHVINVPWARVRYFFLTVGYPCETNGNATQAVAGPSNPFDLLPRESSTLESLAEQHRQSVITVAKAGGMGRD